MPDLDAAVLIVAAGAGKRFGGEMPKQYVRLGDRPVLAHTLQGFQKNSRIRQILTVIADGYEDDFAEARRHLSHDSRILPPVIGGATRQASVRAGLEALGEEKGPDVVLIHDGARPFPSEETLNALLDRLAASPSLGVFAAIPVSDTLRRVSEAGASEATIPREGLWRAQTPQAFPFREILQAHREAPDETFTDDVSLAEHFGLRVEVVRDDPRNLKITSAQDLVLAEALLSGKAAQSPMEYRSGFGYDVHRYEVGRPMVLCGITFPEAEQGLLGHSDADVALHALTDALYGALGEGDIGAHFPPSEDKWKGAPSSVFVEAAIDRLRARGGRLVNADLTIICETPRIGPRRDAMRARVAELTRTTPDRINIKATTTEGLGFTGRREGIAAEAVVSIALPLDAEETGR